MGLLFGRKEVPRKERLWGISQASDLIPRRGGYGPYPHVITADQAMRHSAVWAALRLRADLVSTMPMGFFRTAVIDQNSLELTIPTPLFFNAPCTNPNISFMEWLYMSQVELDRSGNNIGLIKAWDGNGMPAKIDLAPSSACDVLMKGTELTGYRIYGVEYTPDKVWHERQYSVSGLHVGLSPVAYAAWTLGEYESVQQFVTSWFASGAVPRARLKNVEKTLDQKESAAIKEAWRASQSMGEPFVHGNDWEYSLIQASQASADWLEAKRYNDVDVARFFDVPADLIDAAVSGQSITYANISQRNLQFLIMHLGPAIVRRETSFSNFLMQKPRHVLFDSESLLRMDPEQRAMLTRLKIESRQMCPSEARAKDNLPPFTESQMAEFDRFWPPAPPKIPNMGL